MKPALVDKPRAFSSHPSADASDLSLPKPEFPSRTSSLILAGSSFKTSTLAFREELARRLETDSRLPRTLGAREYAKMVTCNRIEILAVVDSPELAETSVSRWLSKTPGFREGSVYLLRDVEAISHLFRVASGLDSMVVGEEQILAQVKDAGVAARTSRSSRGSLSSIFDASISVGRRVRNRLDSGDESVSSIALRFALGRLPRAPRRVLLIGTGKTTRLAASQLGDAKLYVATRRDSLPSFTRAVLVSHKDLKRVAAECDLIISATKHQGYVLKKGDLDRRRRVLLDLGFPRNIDPALNSGLTRVFNLEDLAKLMAWRTRAPGPREVQAEELIAAEAERFSRWLLATRQSSALSAVYQWAEATRSQESDAAMRRLPRLSVRERRVVEAMGRRLVSKLLAPTAGFAKGSSPDLPQDQRLDLVRRIFEQEE